jgi:hypothetical protein
MPVILAVMEGRDQEDCGSKPVPDKEFLKYPIQKRLAELTKWLSACLTSMKP